MAQYQHLRMKKLPQRLERRKRNAYGRVIERDSASHAGRLQEELKNVEVNFKRKSEQVKVDPSLILKVKMADSLKEDEWESLGLTVLSSDSEKHLVLFSSQQDINELHFRLNEYSKGTPEGQKNPRYASFISSIEEIGCLSPEDRIGQRIREFGFDNYFGKEERRVIDIELWDLGTVDVRRAKINEIEHYIESTGDQVLDTYTGPSVSMVRAKVNKDTASTLLDLDEIFLIDLPPEPDLETNEVLNLNYDDVPDEVNVGEHLPVIGVIDSGVNSHPFLENVISGTIAVPENLGEADNNGHGTRVAGIAAYGDLRVQLRQGALVPGGRICSAKVVNHQGRFPDDRLVPSQMREAITTLAVDYGCKIFVISLGLKNGGCSKICVRQGRAFTRQLSV